MEFEGSDIISVNQFDRPDLDKVFKVADGLPDAAKGRVNCTVLDGKILANVFLEASTRTRMCLAAAFMRLGGKVNDTTGMSFSSISKGETLEDTMKVMGIMCDVMALRTSNVGDAGIAAAETSVPVINAGDGEGEHPTQALLDAYTIQAENGGIDGQTVTMTGDLMHGRTVHSLAQLLSRYDDIKYIFAAPDVLQMPEVIVSRLKSDGFSVTQTDDFDAALPESDVLYSTRLQDERHKNGVDFSKKLDESFQLTRGKVKDLCKGDVTIMHPLPRRDEIDTDVDDLPNAAYFRQVEYGLQVRMALYLLIFGKEKGLE